MNKQHPTHMKSFILRAWNEELNAQKPPRWRYVLLDTVGASRRGFTSLDQLFAVLAREISSDALTPWGHAEIMREVDEILGLTPHSPE